MLFVCSISRIKNLDVFVDLKGNYEKEKYQTKIEAFDAKTLSCGESNPDHA